MSTELIVLETVSSFTEKVIESEIYDPIGEKINFGRLESVLTREIGESNTDYTSTLISKWLLQDKVEVTKNNCEDITPYILPLLQNVSMHSLRKFFAKNDLTTISGERRDELGFSSINYYNDNEIVNVYLGTDAPRYVGFGLFKEDPVTVERIIDEKLRGIPDGFQPRSYSVADLFCSVFYFVGGAKPLELLMRLLPEESITGNTIEETVCEIFGIGE